VREPAEAGCKLNSSIRKMEEIRSSETSGCLRSTRRCNPEGLTHQSYLRSKNACVYAKSMTNRTENGRRVQLPGSRMEVGDLCWSRNQRTRMALKCDDRFIAYRMLMRLNLIGNLLQARDTISMRYSNSAVNLLC
jgi:hypothetical protein